MACDMCGKVTNTLESLKSEYATREIKLLCSDCMRLTNNHLWDVRKLSNKLNMNFVQRFMAEFRKNKFKEAQEEDV